MPKTPKTPKKNETPDAVGLDIKSVTKRLAQLVPSCTSEEDLRVNMEFVLREALPDLPKPKYEKCKRRLNIAAPGG